MAASKIAKESLYKLAHELYKGTGMGLQTLGNVITNLETPAPAYEKALKDQGVWGDYEVSPETREFYGGLKTAAMTTPQGQAVGEAGGLVVDALGEVAKGHPEAAMQAMGMLAITDVIPSFKSFTKPLQKAIMDVANNKIDLKDLSADLDAGDFDINTGDYQEITKGLRFFDGAKFNVPSESRNLQTYSDTLPTNQTFAYGGGDSRVLLSKKERISKERLAEIEADQAKSPYAVPVVHVTPRTINPRGLSGGGRGMPYVALQKEFMTPDSDQNLLRMTDLGKAAIGGTDEFGEFGGVGGGSMVSALQMLKRMEDGKFNLDRLKSNFQSDMSSRMPSGAEMSAYQNEFMSRQRAIDLRKEDYLDSLDEGTGVTSIPMLAKRGILGHVEDKPDYDLQLDALAKSMGLPEQLSNETIDSIIRGQKRSGEYDWGSVANLMAKGEVKGFDPEFYNNLPAYLTPVIRQKLANAQRHTVDDMFGQMMGSERVRHNVSGLPDTSPRPQNVVEMAGENFRPQWMDAESGGKYGKASKLARYMDESGFTGMRVHDEMDGLSVAIFHPDNLRHKFYGFGTE